MNIPISSEKSPFYSTNNADNAALVEQENAVLVAIEMPIYDTSTPEQTAIAAEEIRYRNKVFVAQNTWNHDQFKG